MKAIRVMLVSIVVAVGLGLLGMASGSIYLAIFCALFVYINIQALRAPGPEDASRAPETPGGQAQDEMKDSDSRPPLGR